VIKNKFVQVCFFGFISLAFSVFLAAENDLFQEAKLALANKDLNRAFGIYKSILDKDATSAKAIRGLGLTLWMDGRNEEAIICYKRAIEIDPDFISAYADLSVILSDQNLHQKAIEYARRASRLFPKDTLLQLYYADILWHAECYDQAADQYRSILVELPNHLSANVGLASSLIAIGKLNSALPPIAKVVSIDPKHIIARYNRAVVYVKQGKTELAIKDLKFILRQEPKHANAQFELGFAYQQEKQFELAVTTYREALTNNPDDSTIYYNLAQCYARMGQKGQAKAAYQKAKQLQELQQELSETQAYLEKHPNEPKGYLYLGDLYVRYNKTELAQKSYEKALQVSADFLPAYSRLADFYIQQKLLHKATKVYQKAIEHFPKAIEIRVMLGLLHKEQKNFKVASKHLKIAEKTATDRVEARGQAEDVEQLSFVYYAQGRYDEAESLLVSLLTTEPENKKYLDQLKTVRSANTQPKDID